VSTVNKRQFEADLLQALGLEGRHVLGITIKLRPKQMPLVTVVEVPKDDQGAQLLDVLRRYTLVEVPEDGKGASHAA
jgi:hypothetical protein